MIGNGAILDASDTFGQGSLLTALSPPFSFSDCADLTYDDIYEENADNDWILCDWFTTEDRRHIQDYDDIENTSDLLTTSVSSGNCRSNPALDGLEDSQLARDQESKSTTEHLLPNHLSESDLQNDASAGSEEIITNSEGDGCVYCTGDEQHEEHDYVHCINDEGDSVWIRNPKHVLKNRVKTKLKILLEAACDPNEIDNQENSTNDYAWRGLWEQWIWALAMTGYVFDEKLNRWTKWFDTA